MPELEIIDLADLRLSELNPRATPPGDAEVARIEIVLGERASADLPDVGVAGRCQLVEPVVAPKHERRRSSEPEQVGKERSARNVGDASRGGLWPHRITQWAEVVEHSLNAELGAHGGDVAKPGQEARGVHERNAGFFEAACEGVGLERQIDSKGGEYV